MIYSIEEIIWFVKINSQHETGKKKRGYAPRRQRQVEKKFPSPRLGRVGKAAASVPETAAAADLFTLLNRYASNSRLSSIEAFNLKHINQLAG
jgi:hypothetical protein